MNTSVGMGGWSPPNTSTKKFRHQEHVNQRLPEFHFDVNVTSKCNLACTYCSEGESCGLSSTFEQPTTLTPDDLMRKIRELDQSKYQAINIYFWGGEAFTNWPFCKSVMEKGRIWI